MNTLYYDSIYEERLSAWKSLHNFYNWKFSGVYINLNEINPFDNEIRDNELFVNQDVSEVEGKCKIWENSFHHDLSLSRVLRAFKVGEDKEHAFNSNMNMHFLGGHPNL